MNPEKSPNASRVHTYNPPSSGRRDESSITLAASGMKKHVSAATQTNRMLGPAAAAVAAHRTLNPLTT
jgi:hypothetical protein